MEKKHNLLKRSTIYALTKKRGRGIGTYVVCRVMNGKSGQMLCKL